MSYTFTPIPPVDSINDHSGFYVILTIMVVAFIIVWFDNDDEFNMYKVFILFSIPVAIAAVVSWNTGTYIEYANTPMTGKFVKFEAEGYKEKSGKSYVDRHFTYVVYNINGNNVLFRAKEGTEYPQTAVIYKN